MFRNNASDVDKLRLPWVFRNNATDRHTQKSNRELIEELNLDSLKHNPVDRNPDPSGGVPFLRVIITRDPYRWMRSTCRSPYDIRWKMVEKESGTPRKIPTTRRRWGNLKFTTRKKPVNCTDLYPPHLQKLSILFPRREASDKTERESHMFNRDYPSLPHMWSQWHQEYLHAAESSLSQQPTLIIRFEDVLVHAPQVLQAVASCAGMDLIGNSAVEATNGTDDDSVIKVVYPRNRSKNHGRGNAKAGFATTLLHNMNPVGRTAGFTDQFLNFSTRSLDPKLLKLFHYPPPQF